MSSLGNAHGACPACDALGEPDGIVTFVKDEESGKIFQIAMSIKAYKDLLRKAKERVTAR